MTPLTGCTKGILQRTLRPCLGGRPSKPERGNGLPLLRPSAAAARMARAVVLDSGEIMPVCAWVDGQYGISGVYLSVEAEIGAVGVRRVVERDLIDTELADLRTAAEAVRAKQADVASL